MVCLSNPWKITQIRLLVDLCRFLVTVRYIPNKMENIKNFLYELKKLEQNHHIEETSMVKIMRDAYYKTCADELFKLEGPNEVVSE